MKQLIFSILLGFSLLSSVFAEKACGSVPLTEDDVIVDTVDDNGDAVVEATVIDTYFHIISTAAATLQGNITDAVIQQQFAALNTAYAPTGFSFRLAGVFREWNEAAAVSRTLPEELLVKSVRHQGTYRSLNIYFLSDWAPARFQPRYMYGVCDFPLSRPDASQVLSDGCVVQQSTMPGSWRPEANLGFTAVHEVGHWLGLHHPWGDEDSNPRCNLDDYVADTPRQNGSTDGCPSYKKTCPQVRGQDNYRNYMDYSDDRCLTTFTRGQIRRMTRLWVRRSGR